MDPYPAEQKQVTIPSEQILPSIPQEKAMEKLENKVRGTHFMVKENDFVPLLIAAFQNDFTVEEACEYAGIARRTYYRRLKENPDFAAQMKKAQLFPILQAKKKVINIILYGDDRDAGAMARWFLEKREPEIYGKNPTIQQNNQQNNFYMMKNIEVYENLSKKTERISDQGEYSEALCPVVSNPNNKIAIKGDK